MRASSVGVRHGSVQALDQVTIDFEPGTATALMGANGSGKTTLLDCLAGLITPSSGTVETAGHQIAYVRQHPPQRWLPMAFSAIRLSP